MTTSNAPENFCSPPPLAEPCLNRDRLSSQRGGTLINESVTDLETHERWMQDPDHYRPAQCKKCHHDCIHMHDRKSRVLLDDPACPAIQIAIYLCAGCGAIWRILPRFLARHLWRRWAVVEAHSAVEGPPVSWPKLAKRTRRRWLNRLRSLAGVLVQLLATSGSQALSSVAASCGITATRQVLVAKYSAAAKGESAFADLSALIHRLSPGVRLM
jgi:hypothetical protein